jgi:hypothetical protein
VSIPFIILILQIKDINIFYELYTTPVINLLKNKRNREYYQSSRRTAPDPACCIHPTEKPATAL